LSDLNKKVSDDINQTNKNRTMNNNSSASSSPNTGIVDVSFNDFYSMYRFAVKKFNNASYVYTTGSGEANFSGNVLGFQINNKVFNLKFTKSKQVEKRYFNFGISGGVIVEGLPPLSLESTHYTNGTLYKYAVGNEPLVTLTKDNYINKMDWDMTSVFHLANEELLSLVKPEEIRSFSYDNSNKEYVAEVELNPTTFPTNFASILQTIANSTSPARFSKISMTIKVDKNGNFKSIKFSEHVSAKIRVSVSGSFITVDGNLQTSYTENFIIIDNGFVNVKAPF
jgi:hypothetical protein